MQYRNKFTAILAGEYKLPESQRLRMDLCPSEIPPLPTGKAALSPTTKAGWETEAVIRAMISNLHMGRDWKTLYIYGGSGKVARDWKAFFDTIEMLKNLEPNETLFLQSGKPYGKMLTNKWSPRVVITNSIIVPHWASQFQNFVDAGLTVYGQMTAGSFIFIGIQGILQGTYETLAAAIQHAEKKSKFRSLSKFEQRLIVTAGLGLMSGAQPLAIKMNQKIAIVAEINPRLVDRMYNEGRNQGVPYLDVIAPNITEALKIAQDYTDCSEGVSIGVCCNAVDLLQFLVDHQITPNILTDQTSAHDLLNGYYPQNMTAAQADELRRSNPTEYLRLSKLTVIRHVKLMLELHKQGAETFDYGNNIRQQAFNEGLKDAFAFPGFVAEYIRPLFCQGKGPFRWMALSNNPQDIRITDEYAKKLFFNDTQLVNWLNLADKYIPFEKGLPARIFWAGFIGRAAFGMLLNQLVANRILSAPIVIGRDHLDGGSVASPNRETEGMQDGSDAIGDFPLINFSGNALCGATWVSFHQGGGVGVPYSLHAGQVIVADGTRLAQERLFRVLTWDPLSAILRNASADYDIAINIGKQYDLVIPEKTAAKDFDYKKLYHTIITLIKERTMVDLFPPMEKIEFEI